MGNVDVDVEKFKRFQTASELFTRKIENEERKHLNRTILLLLSFNVLFINYRHKIKFQGNFLSYSLFCVQSLRC